MSAPFLGLRTCIFRVGDRLDEAKAWYSKVLGFPPYFDEPFYVGFNVGGYELGLHPEPPGDHPESAVAVNIFWGVANAETALAHLLSHGATPFEGVSEVGGGIKVALVRDPLGNLFGIIENPHFQLPA
ncbi:bleomycin resistance protein [Verrucomicrobia bacterium SCGC AG-212-E04]|nr:bleomycin resistance protein [Verrucomicrobia bacterium SCGC AG-212-E04]